MFSSSPPPAAGSTATPASASPSTQDHAQTAAPDMPTPSNTATTPSVAPDARVNAVVQLLGIAVDKTILQPCRIVGGAVWSATRGSVRVDLVRPTYPQAAPFGRHVPFGARPVRQAFLTDPDDTRRPSAQHSSARAHHQRPYNGGLGSSFKRLATLQSTGARCKIVRHLDVGPLVSGPDEPFPRRMFDIGVGMSFEMDTSSVNAVARIKLLDLCSIKLVPKPVLKLQKTWDLQLKGLALRAVYEVPMDALDTPWAPPARIMLRLDNVGGHGLRFTDAGLEFDRSVHARSKGGVHTLLRAAGGVRFPRQYPVQQGTQLLDVYVRSLGLKTQW